MKRYANLGGKSGVAAYENGSNFIKVQFSTGKIYVYDYSCPGMDTVEHMKQLADSGSGLNSYISSVVKKNFAYIEN